MSSTVKCLEVNFDDIFSRMRFDIMIKRWNNINKNNN